jgi:hypothetical protein
MRTPGLLIAGPLSGSGPKALFHVGTAHKILLIPAALGFCRAGFLQYNMAAGKKEEFAA